MGDFYNQFLPSLGGDGQGQPNSNVRQQPLNQAQPSNPGTSAMGVVARPSPYPSLGFFTGFPEPIMFNPQKAVRNRRSSAPGLDHVKHRRTRSGCYTCRQRRVKCDETHPICERCKKGKRDCHYPEPTSAKSTSGKNPSGDGTSHDVSPESSVEDEDEGGEQGAPLDTIFDDDEQEDHSQDDGAIPTKQPRDVSRRMGLRRALSIPALNLQRAAFRKGQGSESPAADSVPKSSSSPSASTGTAGSRTPGQHQFPETKPMGSATTPRSRPEWAHLSSDQQFYLGYFYENITHLHYCMVTDADDFFRETLPAMALRNEALLNAVVGFAAYHYTVRQPGGKVKDFLQYYNKSVTLLLQSLKKKQGYSLITLMTILQLGTIEEYLGDWVNLMGHQKAALEILAQLYTPQSILETPVTRQVLTWYVRFDVFVGLLGRFETALPRTWFSEYADYCLARSEEAGAGVEWIIEHTSSRLRLISMEMSLLFGRASSGELPPEVFIEEHKRIHKALQDWRANLDPAMANPAYAVTDFAAQPASGSGQAHDDMDIVNPYTAEMLFKPPLFATTVLLCEWHSIIVMHESQASLPPNPEPTPGMTDHSYAICQFFEAVELSPHSPKGSIIILHACVCIAALFLPRDARHHMWMRRKFALVETLGYTFPQTMRARMAELFGDPSCVRWWLPDDEGFTPVLQSIRVFADERNAPATDEQSENLREIRHLLGAIERLKLQHSGDQGRTIREMPSSGSLYDSGRDSLM